MSRIVISGGGTGGHIYPAIGIAQALKQLKPMTEIVFIGGKDRLESTLVPHHGYRFLPISVAGFPRQLTWRWIPVLAKVWAGIMKSLQHLKQFSPDVVVGTGGYVCGPVLFAAVLLGIPTVIQEQNATPGVTNRILARWVKAAYVAFDATAAHFSADIAKVTGNPIRPTIASVERHRATYEKFGLESNRKTVFVMGGSQGAHAVNQVMLDALTDLADFENQLQIVHQTGKADYKMVKEQYSASPLKHLAQPYFDPIDEIYSIADLMVCRAGGMTVSEVTACGIPAIFIPLPVMVGNNQQLNAEAVAEKGAGIVLDQNTLTGTELAKHITDLIADSTKLQEMADASQKLGKPHASEEIASSIYALVKSET